jgi:hypothetical protein
MDTKTVMDVVDLELQIEELEPKIAPDNGETFLPLSLTIATRGHIR